MSLLATGRGGHSASQGLTGSDSCACSLELLLSQDESWAPARVPRLPLSEEVGGGEGKAGAGNVLRWRRRKLRS